MTHSIPYILPHRIKNIIIIVMKQTPLINSYKYIKCCTNWFLILLVTVSIHEPTTNQTPNQITDLGRIYPKFNSKLVKALRSGKFLAHDERKILVHAVIQNYLMIELENGSANCR